MHRTVGGRVVTADAVAQADPGTRHTECDIPPCSLILQCSSA